MLINANATRIPLADESVHCCVTSPPYWGLRDYGTATWVGGDEGCDHVDEEKLAERKRQKKSMIAVGERTDGSTRTRVHDETIGKDWQYRDTCPKCGAVRVDNQLGLEPTPEQYIENMVAVFREVWRVLRKDGTLWLNMGDSYASSTKGTGGPSDKQDSNAGSRYEPRKLNHGLKEKDLCGIPWRLALALQADGWWLRSDIIWHKPNPMPESVTDRPTKSHEYLFLLTKSARYFYDAAAIREEGKGAKWRDGFRGGNGQLYTQGNTFQNSGESFSSGRTDLTPLGGSTLGPELSATLHTNNGTSGARGWCNLSKSEVSIDNAVTREAKRFQVIDLVSFKIGLKTSEGYYMVNLEAVSNTAPLTSEVVALESLFSLSLPISSFVSDLPTAPSWAILSSHVDADPFSGTFARAKVVRLECALVSGKFFAANITVECEETQFSLFVFTSLWSSHVSFTPDSSNNIIPHTERNKRTVWTIPTRPYSGAHFATFPPALVEPCIKAGTSEHGCCPECGAPWERVVERQDERHWTERRSPGDKWDFGKEHGRNDGGGSFLGNDAITTGWKPMCECISEYIDVGTFEEPVLIPQAFHPIPCTVFDPFIGSGTVAMVARSLGRHGIGTDLSMEYLHLARERLELNALDAWEYGADEEVENDFDGLPMFEVNNGN